MKIWKFLLLNVIVIVGLIQNNAYGQVNYYWIGGTGVWTDQAHWSLTSGGAAAVTLPGNADTVRFDASSGATGYTVTNTVVDTVAVLIATNSNAVSLDLDLTVTGGFTGPVIASTFGSLTKTLRLAHGSLVPFIFNPGNFTYAGILRLEGQTLIGIDVTAAINATNNLFLDNGLIQFNGPSVNCKSLFSNLPTTDNRNFIFSTSQFFVSDNQWLINQYSILGDRPQKVVFQGTMNGTFKDSINITTTPYDSLIIPAINKIAIPCRIGIGYMSILADTLELGVSEGLGYESWNTPGLSCVNRLVVKSSSASVNAPLRYLGLGTIATFSYHHFERIAAQNTPAITYNGTNSIQLNSTGFSFGGIPQKFYWIGNGGNWSDPTHWSETSGGAASCFFPQNLDSLIFDVNSFNTANQIVLMDTAIQVGYMDWIGIAPSAATVKFELKKNLKAYGDVSLDPRVHILSTYDTINFQFPSLEFKKTAKLDAGSSIFDVNLVLDAPVADTVRLTSNFVTTDSSSIYLQGGNFKTDNFNIKTLSFFSYSTATTLKSFYMGNSIIRLKDGWDTDTSDFYLNTIPGNSHVIVGRSLDSNFFKSKNQQFYDVTFDFNPRKKSIARGSNSMHHLTISAGSHIEFEATKTYTLDSLIINGGCNKFKIDTSFSYILDYDTVSVDTISTVTVIYQDTSTTNIFGYIGVVPADTLRDSTFTINAGMYLDTTITTQIINNAPVVDTILILGVTNYVSYRTATYYTININVIIDTLGTIPLYDYGVDNDTLTGLQQVKLLSSTAGTAFTFTVNRDQKVFGTQMKDIHITGGTTKTAYFSQSISNNTGWTFNSAPSSLANFSLTGSFCLGDTIAVSNTSTAFSGNFSDLTSVWNFGQSSYLGDSSTYFYESAGTFPISLTTYYTNSCSSVKLDTVTIKSPSVSLSMSEVDTLICANTTIEFSASSLDSLTLFQFYKNGTSLLGPSLVDSILLSNIATNDTIYVVGSRDGCVSYNPTKLIFNVIPLPVVNLASTDANDSICLGESVTFTASGSNKYRYFKNSTPLTSYTTNPVFTVNNLVNNDTIFVRGRIDSSFCENKSPLRIFTVNPLPTVTLSAATASPICAGTSVTFTAGGANLYQFFVNGVSQGAASTTNTFTSNTLANNSIITVRGTSLAMCTALSSALTYTVIPNPVVTLTVDDSDSTICSGTALNFYAFGASVYQFYINNVAQVIDSSTNSFTSSTLTNGALIKVKGSFGLCSNTSADLPITVLGNPTTSLVSSDPNDTICQNQSITYTASGASMYQFFVNGVSVGVPSVTNTYTNNNFTNANIISVVGDNGGCTLSAQKVIAVLPRPNVNITSSSPTNVICDYQSITFTGSGASNYSLVLDGVPGMSQGTPAFNTTLLTGAHTVSILGTALNGCSSNSNSTLNVTVNPQPTAILISDDADQTICAGTSVTFTGSGASTYQFLVNGISQTANSSITTFTTSTLAPGNIISVRGTSNGCVDTSNLLTFTVNPIPLVALASTDADNIFCQGQPTTFNSSGATNYEFFVNGSSQGAPSAASSLDASTLAAGSYTISVQGSTNNCFASSQLSVIVNANPIANLTSSDADNTICAGDLVSFTGSGGSQYQFFVNGVSQGPASALNILSTSALTTGANVNVVASSAAGCTNASSMINTIVNPLPVVGLTTSDADQIICAGELVDFTGSGATNYQFFVNNVSQGPSSPLATFSTSGLTNGQTIKVTGSSLGCSSNSSSIAYTVNPYPSISTSNPSGTVLCGNTPAVVTLSGAGTYQFSINGSPIGAFSGTNTFNQNVSNGDVLTFAGNSFGCVSTSPTSYTFNVTTTPVLSVVSSDADLTICQGDLITFTGTGAQTYNFSVNGLQVQSGATSTFVTDDLEDGFIITAQGFNATCPSNIETLVFVVNSIPLALSINPNYIVCEGDQITLDASGADEYQFIANGSPMGAFSTLNAINYPNILSGDNFTVNGKNNTTGCTQQLGYTISPSVISTVTFNAIGSTTFCAGDSIVMVSNVLYGNQWTLDGTPIAGATNDTLIAFTSGDYGLIQTLGGTGAIWSVGYNGSGGFGDFTNIDSPDAVPATLNQTITNITAGYDFTVGLTSAGTVYAWGTNGSGQLGNGTFTTTNFPILVPTLSNITDIASSSSSTIALNNSGTLSVWGNNNYGQLGVGSNAIINFPFSLTGFNNVSQIAGGKDHFIALKTDGTVWTVGRNNLGQLGLGNLTNVSTYTQVPGLTGITKIGSGENHSFAITSNGDLYVWGNNVLGQLGLGDNINRLTPTLSTLKNIQDATGGANHSLILNENKEVFAVGGNGFGQLGIPALTQTNIPQKLAVGGILDISAGEFTSLLRTTDLRVLGSGYNDEQQVSSSIGNVTTFTYLNDFAGVTKIEAGRRTSHAIFGEAGSCSSTDLTVLANTPTIPVITDNSNILSSTSSIGYQWYHNGIAIPSGTQQSYTVFATGTYYVATTDANGCAANSATMYIEIAGIDDKESFTINIFPNPSNGIYHLNFSAESNEYSSEVVDITGRIVKEMKPLENLNNDLDLSAQENGTYFLRVYKNNVIQIQKPLIVMH